MNETKRLTKQNPYLPSDAKIIDRIQDSKTIFTLRLQFSEPDLNQNFLFQPGQFNMLYLYGVGEVPISIVSDPEHDDLYDHTIRNVGRVTHGLSQLNIGDYIGIRGPFGRGWPVVDAKGKDIIIVTGGLGCAPVVAMINFIMKRREQFGSIKILQGVKHSDDFIFQKRYNQWRREADTEVYLAADTAGPSWPFKVGLVTDYIQQLTINPKQTIAMMCGPEAMMAVATKALLQKALSPEDIFLSLERNMACAVGHCGHCQYGGAFVCKNGPVFSYNEISELFKVPGF